MTSKIFRSTVFVAVVVLLCSLGIVIGVLYNHFTGVQVEQLKDELSLAVTGTEQYGNAFLENVEADRFRVTWIDTDGTVLFDTQVDQTTRTGKRFKKPSRPGPVVRFETLPPLPSRLITKRGA